MLNDALAKNDPDLLSPRAPGDADEQTYAEAVRKLLTAQAKVIAAYHEKLDPSGKLPFPPALIYAKAIAPEQIRASEVRHIDDDHAEVIATGLGRYRVMRIDDQWSIQIIDTIGLRYPSDPVKAVQVLARMFQHIAAMYETGADEITSGKLATTSAVTTALTSRLARIMRDDGAQLPRAAIALPLMLANDSFINATPQNADYKLGIDPQTRRLPDSPPAGHIQSLTPGSTNMPAWASGIVDEGDLDALRGKRVRFTGWIKTANVSNWAGIQLWAAGPNKKVWVLDDMGDRPIHGTTDWQQYSLVADIPKDTVNIELAAFLRGGGELWCDDFQADVVSSDVPITDNQAWHPWSQTATKYSATLDPDVRRDGRPAMRLSSTTARRNEWGCYDHDDRTPDKYLGHRIRVTAWMKCENVVKGAGLWIRVLGPNDRYVTGEVAPARRPLKGTLDWNQYSIEADVPPDAMAVDWGFVLDATGKVWVDLDTITCEVVEDPGKQGL
jgi:hypothetical protein